jgi:hypothetical protein
MSAIDMGVRHKSRLAIVALVMVALGCIRCAPVPSATDPLCALVTLAPRVAAELQNARDAAAGGDFGSMTEAARAATRDGRTIVTGLEHVPSSSTMSEVRALLVSIGLYGDQGGLFFPQTPPVPGPTDIAEFDGQLRILQATLERLRVATEAVGLSPCLNDR